MRIHDLDSKVGSLISEVFKTRVKKILENIDKQDLINTISDRAREKLINYILESLHELVVKYKDRQSLAGYAFEISKQLGGMLTAREIEKLYKERYSSKNISENKIIDNDDGWGVVPLNKDVDYFGLRVFMKPSVFLKLVAPLDREPSEKIQQHISSGGKIGSPFIEIRIPAEWEDGVFDKDAEVVGHEGRNRMRSILKVHGDIPIETHLFFRNGVRRRHLTDAMISKLNEILLAERSKTKLKGPFFSEKSSIKEDGRIIKGVNTTVDVGPNEIKTQAAKFGNRVDRDGRPPTMSKRIKGKSTNVLFNLGLAESKKSIFQALTEAQTHTVQSGDTLYNISRRYGVSVENLQTWNELNGNTIRLGQELYISEPEPVVVGSSRPRARPESFFNTYERLLMNVASSSGIQGRELAQLLAQTAHETGNYNKWIEQGDESYFDKYEGSETLGNTEAGDGFKFRGRGYVQLTGRYNYTKAGEALGYDLVNNPELAARPDIAAPIAIWYWNTRVRAKASDPSDTAQATRLIQGKSGGLESRKQYFDQYMNQLRLINQETGISPTRESKYTALELAIMEGGHALGEDKPKKQGPGDLYTQLENVANNKIKYNVPNFDHEWEEAERYPEFVKIGKAAWIELVKKGRAITIKSAKGINNTDAADPNSFKSLDSAKQKRALAQLEKGEVEMPIVAVYSDGWKELIGGNTRLTAMMAKDGQATIWAFKVPDEVAELAENFADGKVKGKSRPGRVKRAGASCNGSVTDLRKRAKNSSGEKAKMYHWCANMKSGRKK